MAREPADLIEAHTVREPWGCGEVAQSMGIRLSCVKPALALSRYRIWMNAVGTYGSILGVRMLKPTSGLPVIACTASA